MSSRPAPDGAPVPGSTPDDAVHVDQLMADVERRVRERLRRDLLAHGAPRDFEDAELFAVVEQVLHSGVDRGASKVLLLPELLGAPDTWRLDTAMRWPSHRARGPAAVVRFVKQRLLMPLLRWLFEYSRDNFERQRRVNQVLFACVQELAVETARLRKDLQRR